MFKRLFLLLTLASCQLMAMESLKGPEAPRFSTKHTRVAFADGRTKKWPEESDQVSLLERTIATKLFAEYTKTWNALIKQGVRVLQVGTPEEQKEFFASVIEHHERPPHKTAYIKSNKGSETMLFYIALFCNTNQGNGAHGIWDKFLGYKAHIDSHTFKNISIRDQQLIMRLYQFPHALCGNKMNCGFCTDAANSHLARKVVGKCCADKLRLGIVCDVCALKIKTDLSLQLCSLICGFHDFQTPVIEMKHLALIEWAVKEHAKLERYYHV